MGAGSARIFERGDAGRLIGVDAGRKPRVNMGHHESAVLPGVEIGVEHAISPTELELEAAPFLDLERGASEMGRQVARRHAREARHLALRGPRLNGLHRRRRRLHRPRGAAGEKQSGSEKQATHQRGMPARVIGGKVAAHIMGR